MPVLSRKKTRSKKHRVNVGPRWQIQRDVTPSPYFRWKGSIGRPLAGLLLLPGLPMIALLVVLARLTSRGPGIHRQTRVGKNGRTFTMYKIRTMRQNAEDGTGAVWTAPNDARITPVGRVLRKLHLDELPQLFNVIKGEMHLIGPRPERPEFVHTLARRIPGYWNRLAVPPGITGLAQINLPPDSDLDSVRRKLVLDLDYIRHAGLLLDVRMFFCTSVRLLGLPGDYAMRLFRLRRDVPDAAPSVAASNGASLTDNSVVTPAWVAAQALDRAGNGNGKTVPQGDPSQQPEPEAEAPPKPR